MAKLVIDVEPFVMVQHAYILKDGNIIDQFSIHEDEIDSIIKYCKQNYDIEQVHLCGNEDYLNQFKNKIKLDFDLNDIDVCIINN